MLATGISSSRWLNITPSRSPTLLTTPPLLSLNLWLTKSKHQFIITIQQLKEISAMGKSLQDVLFPTWPTTNGWEVLFSLTICQAWMSTQLIVVILSFTKTSQSYNTHQKHSTTMDFQTKVVSQLKWQLEMYISPSILLVYSMPKSSRMFGSGTKMQVGQMCLRLLDLSIICATWHWTLGSAVSSLTKLPANTLKGSQMQIFRHFKTLLFTWAGTKQSTHSFL
jgi:hypothetical protein